MAGPEQFTFAEVEFDGVPGIAEGFVDEAYRVGRQDQPAVPVSVVNAGGEPVRMLRQVGFGPRLKS